MGLYFSAAEAANGITHTCTSDVSYDVSVVLPLRPHPSSDQLTLATGWITAWLGTLQAHSLSLRGGFSTHEFPCMHPPFFRNSTTYEVFLLSREHSALLSLSLSLKEDASFACMVRTEERQTALFLLPPPPPLKNSPVDAFLLLLLLPQLFLNDS